MTTARPPGARRARSTHGRRLGWVFPYFTLGSLNFISVNLKYATRKWLVSAMRTVAFLCLAACWRHIHGEACSYWV